MASPVSWQREGHTTVSAYVVSKGAQKVIDFMTDVLNAKVLWNMPNADKTGVMHACLKIGDTAVMVQDETQEHPAAPAWLYVYLEDVDKTYEMAMKHDGAAASVQAPRDECYGDRTGAVKDCAGNTWWIATHKFVTKCSQTA